MKIYIDLLGYFALVINLYSMYSNSERKLRMYSTIANSLYIIYGILLNAMPIIIGCLIAVCLHIYRLNNISSSIQKNQSPHEK